MKVSRVGGLVSGLRRTLVASGSVVVLLALVIAGTLTSAVIASRSVGKHHSHRAARVHTPLQGDKAQPVGDVNMDDLSKAAAANPAPQSPRLPERDRQPTAGGTAHPALKTPALASPVVAPSLDASGFDSVDLVQMSNSGTGKYANTNGVLEPPDQALCVGNGFVLEGVNQSWMIHRTNGEMVTAPVPLTQFFKIAPVSTVPPSSFVSDPRCVYDAQSKRFISVILEADQSNGLLGWPFLRAHTYVGVSKTSDPTGDWSIFGFDVTDDGLSGTPLHVSCPCLGDQPLLGVNADGVYITTNEYSYAEILPVPLPNQAYQLFGRLPDFRNGPAQVYALSKTELLRGGSPKVVNFDAATEPLPPEDKATTGAVWSSLQPAHSPPGDKSAEPAGGAEYFLSAMDFAFTGDHRVAVWALTNTSSLRTASPKLKLVHTVIETRDKSETYTSPLYGVDQKNGPHPLGESCGCPLEKLNANDDRMNEVMLTNGALWGALNTTMPAINPKGKGTDVNPRAGVMYFQVRPHIAGGQVVATMERDGYVQVPRNNVIFPAVAASPKGPVAVFFTLTGIDHFPSAAWARLDGLAPGEAPKVEVSAPGMAPEDGFTGYPLDPIGLGIPISLSPLDGGGVARWGDYSFAGVDEQGCLWGASEYIPGGERDTNANWGTFVTRVRTPECRPGPMVKKLAGNKKNVQPCQPLFTDPAGDDVFDADILPVPGTNGSAPQLDILKGEMKLSADGKTLSTILTINDLTKTMPPSGLGNEYYFYWQLGGKTYYTNAEITPASVTYTDGVNGASGRTSRTAGPQTTGSVKFGKHGTVTVNVPTSAIGSPKLHDIIFTPNAETREREAGVLVLQFDSAGPQYDYEVGAACS